MLLVWPEVMETTGQNLQLLSVHSEFISVCLKTAGHPISHLQCMSSEFSRIKRLKGETNQVRIQGKVSSVDNSVAGEEKREKEKRKLAPSHPWLHWVLSPVLVTADIRNCLQLSRWFSCRIVRCSDTNDRLSESTNIKENVIVTTAQN